MKTILNLMIWGHLVQVEQGYNHHYSENSPEGKGNWDRVGGHLELNLGCGSSNLTK